MLSNEQPAPASVRVADDLENIRKRYAVTAAFGTTLGHS